MQHVLRVVDRLRDTDVVTMAAGYLHDVIEDTGTTVEDLRIWFPADVIDVVLAVTRNKAAETYAGYIERIATLPGEVGRRARLVKLADLADHLDRNDCPAHLQGRYEAAVARLGKVA